MTFSTGANNLIPMEIALKIANKIRARDRFSAYILIPMWPEGVPTGTPTQRILFWQVGTKAITFLKFRASNYNEKKKNSAEGNWFYTLHLCKLFTLVVN